MSTMSISTLELLEQSDMPPAYARAIAKALENDFSHRLGSLATKEDLHALKEDVHILKQDVRVLREDLLATKAELKSEINGVRLNMAEMKSELQLEIAAVKTELSVDIRDIKSDVVRWLFLGIMGQTALFSGIMYYLLRLTALNGPA